MYCPVHSIWQKLICYKETNIAFMKFSNNTFWTLIRSLTLVSAFEFSSMESVIVYTFLPYTSLVQKFLTCSSKSINLYILISSLHLLVFLMFYHFNSVKYFNAIYFFKVVINNGSSLFERKYLTFLVTCVSHTYRIISCSHLLRTVSRI